MLKKPAAWRLEPSSNRHRTYNCGFPVRAMLIDFRKRDTPENVGETRPRRRLDSAFSKLPGVHSGRKKAISSSREASLAYRLKLIA
jgi:hypothetical protein